MNNAQALGEEELETPSTPESDGDISRQIRRDNWEYLFNQLKQ